MGRAEDAIIALSNYRLHIKFKESLVNVSDHQLFSHSSRWRKEVKKLVDVLREECYTGLGVKTLCSAFISLDLSTQGTRLASSSYT